MPGEPVPINLPASKSISNRLLVMQALSKNLIEIDNLSAADDTVLLGKAIIENSGELWLGDAGTALRFGLAWAAITPGVRILRGSKRLSERPVRTLVDALRKLGADIRFPDREGYLPIEVRGKPLQGGAIEIETSVSSQFTTALMLIGPYLAGGLHISRKGATVSEPYIAMTQSLMEAAGAFVTVDSKTIQIQQGGYSETHFDVESDWSAASYFYAACAFSENMELRLKGLQKASTQGDAAVVRIFRSFGVQTRYTATGVHLSNTGYADETAVINFLNCPDLAQTVAVVAAGLRRPCRLEGLQTLRVKETDRIAALVNELAKCGVTCESGPDYLELKSFAEPDGIPHIGTYGDHRMAMAFAPLALVLGEIVIESPGVVSKSFPGFWEEIRKIGMEA